MDSIHDEIVVPNPFAEAILFFRGGADGEEAPIRVIQGARTKLNNPSNVALDPQHDEVFVAQGRDDAVLVFDRRARGDVAPLRVLQGPKTKLSSPARVAVDPIHNLLAVTIAGGILIFNRTDEGDVPPRAVISGPNTRIAAGFSASRDYKASKFERMNYRASRIVLYPEGQKIFVSVPGRHTSAGVEDSFIAIWKYGDQGDVPPWAILKGPQTMVRNPYGGVALNPQAKELIVVDNLNPPALLVFRLPEVFQ